MKHYHFLLKPRWILFLLVGLLLAISFTSLGFWQLYRLDQRKMHNNLIQSRILETPLDVLQLASQFDITPAFNETSIAYRPIIATGQYDSNAEVLLRSTQNYQGLPGYYVLTPLVLQNIALQDKKAVLVMRGWVPFEMNTLPLTKALPPAEEITIKGSIELERKPISGFLSSLTPKDPVGKLSITAYIDTERLEQQMPYDLLPFYIRLNEQTPAQTLDFPKPLEEFEFGDGPHLAYAIQWFSFTVIGIIGYILLIRKMANDANASEKNSR